MTIRVIVLGFTTPTGTGMNFEFEMYNVANNNFIDNPQIELTMGTDLTSSMTTIGLLELFRTKLHDYATAHSHTLTDDNIIWNVNPDEWTNILASTQALSVNNAPGRSIVTGTGATGFQISATRNALALYTPKIITTATIAGGQEGYVVLEIATTNSATAGDWKEVSRLTNGQALSLAITLQSIQPVSAPISGIVPAGYYAKLRSVNTTGTPAFSMVSGQEILL